MGIFLFFVFAVALALVLGVLFHKNLAKFAGKETDAAGAAVASAASSAKDAVTAKVDGAVSSVAADLKNKL